MLKFMYAQLDIGNRISGYFRNSRFSMQTNNFEGKQISVQGVTVHISP